jgi:LPXTG-site transpeptidase (sortase) family protein
LKDSPYNNVDYGIYTMPISNYPDVPNGNLALAAHSGNASISYFKHLWKLKIGDVANVSYNGKTYSYKIVDIYYVEKTGTVQIKRNTKKTTMTLITCTKNNDKLQTVYILELYAIDGESYG